jgi:membrane associated rhomboid family serine protease
MLIPISDDNSDRQITPFINYTFVIINLYVFIFLQGLGSNLLFTYAYATVPEEILTGTDIITNSQVLIQAMTGQEFVLPGLQLTPIPVWLTVITSMFMHGGIAHIAGNMLYLWIFGDNIENRLGHFRYIVFYLVCGIIATLSQVFTTYVSGGDLLTPSLGASGAISGILGAYIRLFPKRTVFTLLGWLIVPVPAVVALGLWIAFQVISGLGVLGGEETGVAYAAHISGFIAGYILIGHFGKASYKKGKAVRYKKSW